MKSDSKDFVGELTLLDPRPSFPGVEPSKEKKKQILSHISTLIGNV